MVVSLIVGGTRCTQRKPPAAGHQQTLSQYVVSSTHRHERDLDSQVVIDTDCTDSWKSNYHAFPTIMRSRPRRSLSL
jgi:hypothetical protein